MPKSYIKEKVELRPRLFPFDSTVCSWMLGGVCKNFGSKTHKVCTLGKSLFCKYNKTPARDNYCCPERGGTILLKILQFTQRISH